MKTNYKPSAAFRAIVLVIVAAFLSLVSESSFAQPKPVKKGYADVNGIKLYYEIYGKGEPLVLLHGGLGAIEMFGTNIATLAKGREVIAVDLQGHGRTADIDRALSVEFMADDIAGLLKYLNLSRADIMGYSLGGGVAFQMAIRHPEMVRKLVLASTPLRRSYFYPEILAMQGQVNPAMAEQMKQTPMYEMYARLNPKPEDWPRLLGKIGDFMKAEYDLTKEVSRIKAPTLVVAGDADIFPPKYAVETFELLGGGQRDGGWDGSGRPKSDLAILPGVTHYTMANSPALATVAIQFLDSPVLASK